MRGIIYTYSRVADEHRTDPCHWTSSSSLFFSSVKVLIKSY